MNCDWFEMRAIRKRKLDSAVWIPLRASHRIEKIGDFGFAGFKEEFFGAGTLAVPITDRMSANRLGWSDLGLQFSHRPSVDATSYTPSEVYLSDDASFQGVHLVLDQHIDGIETDEWHLNQDLVVALCLKREGDSWVNPNEGYIEVVRLERSSDGSPTRIEIKAEHLKDYLCARSMALYATTYRRRSAVAEEAGDIGWPDSPMVEEDDGARWRGSYYAIHEGGELYGAKTAVLHVARTNVDGEEDVPTFGLPKDDEVASKSWTIEHKGEKLWMFEGELWRNEWVEPGPTSPRVRYDDTVPSVFFITDSAGTKESSSTLSEDLRWLWFRPDVIMALAHRRGGALNWYTRHTGSLRCSPGSSITFGENPLGLINVYAKEIGGLPEWQQRIWAGYNVGPDGGVSEELLAAQAEGIPVGTKAPEAFLRKGLEYFRAVTEERFGVPLLRHHDQFEQIIERCHRFRATDPQGFFALAKDLARLTADSIDAPEIHKLLHLPKNDRPGSLKSLERLLEEKVGLANPRRAVGPLVGIYDLRLADAHLPASHLADAFTLAQVGEHELPVHQGFQILDTCVATIHIISEAIAAWDPSQT